MTPRDLLEPNYRILVIDDNRAFQLQRHDLQRG